MNNRPRIEKILWSIALPGFGQFLNGKILKGIVLIFLEFLINVQANINTIILLSFNGNIQQAIETANYQWLMFYPCIYMFAIFDAYRDAGGDKVYLSFLPFVVSAYTGTLGVIYSATFTIFGVLLGPVFLPILFFGLGITIGLILRFVLRKTLLQA